MKKHNIETQTSPRVQQLTLLLEWEGRLNNGRVRALFGLSGIRASEWIREFRESDPKATEWNSKSRSFHATTDFYQRKRGREKSADDIAASLTRYTSLVGLPKASAQNSGARVTWAAFPEISAPAPRVFSTLAEAAQAKVGVSIVYRSMRDPEPHVRTIFPHNLVRAGRRWHVRAYCSQNSDFRDFTLGRVVEAKTLLDPAEFGELDDDAWNTHVPVKLIPHPELTHPQQRLIQFEYLNNTASRIETCRGSLVGYFVQDVRAATEMDGQHPPDYQLAVENIDEVKPWLFPSSRRKL